MNKKLKKEKEKEKRRKKEKGWGTGGGRKGEEIIGGYYQIFNRRQEMSFHLPKIFVLFLKSTQSIT